MGWRITSLNSRKIAEKTSRIWDKIHIDYTKEHWNILRNYRNKALKILDLLKINKFEGYVHGSLSRGDLDQYSDIDVILLEPVSSHRLELTLTMGGYKIFSRSITQATPGHTPKGHIYLDSNEKISVTFPLIQFRPLELEFYKFGGIADISTLKNGIRVPGSTKRLTLIEPTRVGHFESNILGREAEVADILNLNLDIIKERIRVLTRRDRKGRTGIFLKVNVGEDDSFEKILKKSLDSNPALRRTYLTRKRG